MSALLGIAHIPKKGVASLSCGKELRCDMKHPAGRLKNWRETHNDDDDDDDDDDDNNILYCTGQISVEHFYLRITMCKKSLILDTLNITHSF